MDTCNGCGKELRTTFCQNPDCPLAKLPDKGCVAPCGAPVTCAVDGRRYCTRHGNEVIGRLLTTGSTSAL